MKYNADVSIEDAGHKLVHLKDRSKKSKPGKFSARAKADKPKNRILERLNSECKKESLRDIELCKRRISQPAFLAARPRTKAAKPAAWKFAITCAQSTPCRSTTSPN
jgi:hypothetical protein